MKRRVANEYLEFIGFKVASIHCGVKFLVTLPIGVDPVSWLSQDFLEQNALLSQVGRVRTTDGVLGDHKYITEYEDVINFAISSVESELIAIRADPFKADPPEHRSRRKTLAPLFGSLWVD
jgi:hypothetical protein